MLGTLILVVFLPLVVLGTVLAINAIRDAGFGTPNTVLAVGGIGVAGGLLTAALFSFSITDIDRDSEVRSVRHAVKKHHEEIELTDTNVGENRIEYIIDNNRCTANYIDIGKDGLILDESTISCEAIATQNFLPSEGGTDD